MGRVPINLQPVNRRRDHNAAQRAQDTYRLWLRGKSFEAIARDLGYHDGTAARKAWERARKALIAPPDLVAEVERERARLEIAYAGIADRVEQGNDWAIDRFLGINKAKRDMLGLDAKDSAAQGPIRREYVGVLLEGV